MTYLLDNMALAIKKGEYIETPYGNLMDWTTHIEEEGVTVLKSPMVGFSLPPDYEYMILETGEKFHSSLPNNTEAYFHWKGEKDCTSLSEK